MMSPARISEVADIGEEMPVSVSSERKAVVGSSMLETRFSMLSVSLAVMLSPGPVAEADTAKTEAMPTSIVLKVIFFTIGRLVWYY